MIGLLSNTRSLMKPLSCALGDVPRRRRVERRERQDVAGIPAHLSYPRVSHPSHPTPLRRCASGLVHVVATLLLFLFSPRDAESHRRGHPHRELRARFQGFLLFLRRGDSSADGVVRRLVWSLSSSQRPALRWVPFLSKAFFFPQFSSRVHVFYKYTCMARSNTNIHQTTAEESLNPPFRSPCSPSRRSLARRDLRSKGDVHAVTPRLPG